MSGLYDFGRNLAASTPRHRSWTTRIPAAASLAADASSRIPIWSQTSFGRRSGGSARISSVTPAMNLGARKTSSVSYETGIAASDSSARRRSSRIWDSRGSRRSRVRGACGESAGPARWDRSRPSCRGRPRREWRGPRRRRRRGIRGCSGSGSWFRGCAPFVPGSERSANRPNLVVLWVSVSVRQP